MSAFNTVPSEVQFDAFERRTAETPSVVCRGDDAAAKDVCAALIRDMGFEPVDAGPLRACEKNRRERRKVETRSG